MSKDNTLRIKEWSSGIAASPDIGFAQMVNVDIFSSPGSVKISNKLIADENSASVITGLVQWYAQDPRTGDIYAVDDEGELYLRDNGTGTWSVITGHGTTNANGEGIAVWKDYLFYARATRLDVYGPLSGTPAWINDWEAVSAGVDYDLIDPSPSSYHPMLNMTNSVLAIGNAFYVDTLEQTANTTFDPTDDTTWLYNDKDFELDSPYRVDCLEQLGSDMAIGTSIGSNDTINIADTFFWDRSSNFFDSNKTIRFAENGVKMMKNAGNTLYTIAGLGNTRLFKSFTAQAVEEKRFNNIERRRTQPLRLFPSAIDQIDGEIYMGIGQAQGVGGPRPMGVYSYRNGAYVLRHLVPSLEDGTNDDVLIGAIKSRSSERILVSWRDETASLGEFGVATNSDLFYTGYSAYIDSAFYTVGSDENQKTFERVQVIMARALSDGDGVRILARKNMSDGFTLVATFDTPAFTGKSSFGLPFMNLSQFTTVQFRIQITCDPEATISPELEEVIFI